MKNNSKATKLRHDALHHYGTAFEREETISFLYDYARLHKQSAEGYWDKMKRYSLLQKQFSAARDRTDYDKAKQRENIVKFICDNNELEFKNSRNERSLNIYGTAAFKVCWDDKLRLGCDEGDVDIQCADIKRLITDPSSSTVDGCEYIGYSYPMHKNRAKRVFKEDLLIKGEDFESYLENGGKSLFSPMISSDTFDTSDDNVTVTEWWFRQPEDGQCSITHLHDGVKTSSVYKWKAGDIALCVLINGKEIRYIPKYWNFTNYSSFPFVIYSKLPKENSIWGKSELEEIIPLIDAKDRELVFAQLNSAYCSNDVILAEENALSDGETLDNSPGAVWKLRPGMMGKVTRLGNGSANQSSLYGNGAYWQGLIENTVGNFEVSQGKEPSNVTTATGIALLNERSETRKSLKNADRTAGFKRLFLLCDMTALEHYNDGRVIRMGFGDEFIFSYGGYFKGTREKRYIPSLDVTVHLGNALTNSKAFTVSALTTLMNMKITQENYPIAKAYLQTIAIPESEKICEFLDLKFSHT